MQESRTSCDGWDLNSAGLSRDFETSVSKQGVVYSLNISTRFVAAGPPEDNLTLLGRFDGFENGSLNLVVHVSMHASAGRGYPYYEKSEIHFVHLPVVADQKGRLCISAAEISRGFKRG